MEIVEIIAPLRERLSACRSRGESIAVVPTMGALHDGHLELVRRACERCDRVVVTIFVNPTQFGPGEDFDAYPRDLQRDLDRLRSLKVDFVFAPEAAEMYPDGTQTSVCVAPLGDMLIGAMRPGHFQGVATVVAKLFHVVQPDAAFFGEKDFQQLTIVRRMVRDLMMPIEIVGVPTVRESDGLAMSSRNVRLTPEDRRAATVIARALDRGERAIGEGSATLDEVLADMRATIAAEPRAVLKSLDIRHAQTLQEPMPGSRAPLVILVTATFGDVLLLDQRCVERGTAALRSDLAA